MSRCFSKSKKILSFLSVISLVGSVFSVGILPVRAEDYEVYQALIVNNLPSENLKSSNLLYCVDGKLSIDYIQVGDSKNLKLTYDQDHTVKIIDSDYVAPYPNPNAPIAANNSLCQLNTYPVIASATFRPKTTDAYPVVLSIEGNPKDNDVQPLIFSNPVTEIVDSGRGKGGGVTLYTSYICINDETKPRKTDNSFLDLPNGTYQVSYPDLNTFTSCGIHPKFTVNVVNNNDGKYTYVKFNSQLNPAYTVKGVDIRVQKPPIRLTPDTPTDVQCTPKEAKIGEYITCVFEIPELADNYYSFVNNLRIIFSDNQEKVIFDPVSCYMDEGNKNLICNGLDSKKLKEGVKDITLEYSALEHSSILGPSKTFNKKITIVKPTKTIVRQENVLPGSCQPINVESGQKFTCTYPLTGDTTGNGYEVSENLFATPGHYFGDGGACKAVGKNLVCENLTAPFDFSARIPIYLRWDGYYYDGLENGYINLRSKSKGLIQVDPYVCGQPLTGKVLIDNSKHTNLFIKLFNQNKEFNYYITSKEDGTWSLPFNFVTKDGQDNDNYLESGVYSTKIFAGTENGETDLLEISARMYAPSCPTKRSGRPGVPQNQSSTSSTSSTSSQNTSPTQTTNQNVQPTSPNDPSRVLGGQKVEPKESQKQQGQTNNKKQEDNKPDSTIKYVKVTSAKGGLIRTGGF